MADEFDQYIVKTQSNTLGSKLPENSDDEFEQYRVNPKIPSIIEQMPWYQKAAIGMGGGIENAGLGFLQRVLEGGQAIRNATGMESNQENVNKVQNMYEENRNTLNTLNDSYAAKGGEIIGNVLPYVLMPGGVAGNGATRLGTSALMGGTMGTLSPTGKNDSVTTNTLLGVGGGVLGSAATSVLGKLYNTVADKIPVNQIQELSKKYGIRATLGEITDNPLWKRTETWLEQFPLIGLKSFRQKQEMEAQTAATNFFSKYVVNPEANSTAAMKEMNDTYISNLYSKVRENVPNLPLGKADTTKVTAKELLDRYPTVFESLQDNKTKGILKNIVSDTSTTIKKESPIGFNRETTITTKTPEFSFDDLWEARKGIGQAIGQARQAKNETALGILNKIYYSISDDMDSMLAKSGNKELMAFKEANNAFKQYNVKFDALREAYDKAMGTTGAGEMFSPKKFSTALKNLANDPNYKKNVQWSPQEVDEMTGLANILQSVKRSSQSAENPPTGNRWGGLLTLVELGTAKTAGAVGIGRFLTSTTIGKRLAMSASKVEPNSPEMTKIVSTVMNLAPKMVASGATREY